MHVHEETMPARAMNPANAMLDSGRDAGSAAGSVRVLAIDPGTEQSAWVLYDGVGVLGHDIVPNTEILQTLVSFVVPPDDVVFEQIEAMGMAVGREVFETVHWTGRFHERAESVGLRTHRLPRRPVKLHLCGSMSAKDANIRQSLLDRFGGKERAVGSKKAPGPLHGIRLHEWAALALAVTFVETRQIAAAAAERS